MSPIIDNCTYTDLLKKGNDFTKSQQNVNIKVNDRQNNRTHTTMNNALKTLNETQWKNIQSAYKAKSGGFISANQYRDNLKKNGVSDTLINPQKDVKPASQNISIPKEKKERERLMDITGAYNLNKVDRNELQKHIKLENKTPDDYHDVNQPYHIEKKRIDEAFGPKTDFSISNFENNFDKMNKEEQAMLTYKMQKEFNKTGYTDFNGEKLKEDGIFGEKTKSAYKMYKEKNEESENHSINTPNNKTELPISDLIHRENRSTPEKLVIKGIPNITYSPVSNKITETKSNKNLSGIRLKEDSHLSFDDQKKIDALVYTHNNTDNIIEKEACVRAIVKIRQQKKYKSIYSNSDKNGLYIDNYEYEYPDSGVVANVDIMSEGAAWLQGGENNWNEFLQGTVNSLVLKDKTSDVLDLLLNLVKLSDPSYYEKAKKLKENDIMVTIDGIYPDSEQTIHNKYFYRDKRGHLHKILEND